MNIPYQMFTSIFYLLYKRGIITKEEYLEVATAGKPRGSMEEFYEKVFEIADRE